MSDRDDLRRAWAMLEPEEEEDLRAIQEAFEGEASIESITINDVQEYPRGKARPTR